MTAAAAPDAGTAACPAAERPDYATRQLVTCLGNKRALLGAIEAAVLEAARRLGRARLDLLDAFSGSGAVSRLFKRHARRLDAVDLEAYAACLGRCYLRNRETVDEPALARRFARLAADAADADLPRGFVEELYAPADDGAIQPGERAFYTRANARRLDTLRRLIEREPPEDRDLFLGPLLSEASIHANTAGVFKGFYKDRASGLGKFGGTHGDALARITGAVALSPPPLSAFSCPVRVFQGDANRVVPGLGHFDLAYLDPPYNQHPYGANYFMLNLLVDYRRPARVSPVSGIPPDWRRSDYNVRRRAAAAFAELLDGLDARFVLVSFNSEGFIARDELLALLEARGRVDVREIAYPAFRGARNLRGRSPRVTEYLFLLEMSNKATK